MIDPISGEQYNISAIADGQSVSMPVEWPVEITDFQWALYNQNGELCVEATTDISQAESGVTLLLTGDGNLDDVQEILNNADDLIQTILPVQGSQDRNDKNRGYSWKKEEKYRG